PPPPALFPYTTLFRSPCCHTSGLFFPPCCEWSRQVIHVRCTHLCLCMAPQNQIHAGHSDQPLCGATIDTPYRAISAFCAPCPLRSEEHTSELQSRENL